METIGMEVQKREALGKEAAKKMRREGIIPAVIYGPTIDTTPLAINFKDISKIVDTGGRENVLIDLKIKGINKTPLTKTVIIKDIQRDPVKRNINHVDFLEVQMDRVIRVSVPVHITGEAKGVEVGGILQHETRELEVECLPSNIPDSIDVDVTDLDIGESLHVRDITVHGDVKILEEDEQTIVSVVTPQKEVEEKTAEELEQELSESFEEGEKEEGVTAAVEEAKAEGEGGEGEEGEGEKAG
jgi:large subunit ribosomal protein L25